MGREAIVHADVGGASGEAKALLESTELILRGAIRRRFAKADMTNVRADGDALRFDHAGETVGIQLGNTLAAAWAKAILTPPPSLRAKLGLDKGAKALLIGTADDDMVLTEALHGRLTDTIGEAGMIIARIAMAEDVRRAQAAHALAPHLPIWTVYAKGRSAAYGDTAIRTHMRASGFKDTKSCAVSDVLTATRYTVVRDPG